MKKTVLAFVTFVCLTTAVNAQKGSILLYGNVGFSSNSNGGSSLNTNEKGNFTFNPGVGYQLNNAWTVGVEGGYNYQDFGTNASIDRQYSAGAFLRHSQHLAGIFSAFAQLGLGWQGMSSNDGFSVSKASGFYASITPAIYADIKKGFGLNFSVGGLNYGSMKATGASNTGSTFGFTFGKTLSVGLSKNFGGK